MNAKQLFVGAALTLLCGAGLAQTTQYPSTAPTDKMSGQTQDAAQAPGAAARGDTTDKMSGQTPSSSADSQTAAKAKASTKTAAAKHGHSSRHAEEIAMTDDEKAYRNALRQCAREQDETVRGSCLDNAIEQFGRNA